jgi:hypothetical protein
VSISIRKWRDYLKDLKFLGEVFTTKGQAKYFLPWVQSLSKDYLLRKPSAWICFPAIDFIKQWAQKQKDLSVFEYGSGGSTLYWLSMNCQVVSIEHDPDWFAKLNKVIPANARLDYRLVEPEPCSQIPAEYNSGHPQYQNFDFQHYVTQIDPYPDETFDIVLVDGRSRPFCMQHAVSKVRKGGLLILDNADTPYYLPDICPHLKEFKELAFIGVTPTNYWFTQTNIYIKENGKS